MRRTLLILLLGFAAGVTVILLLRRDVAPADYHFPRKPTPADAALEKPLGAIDWADLSFDDAIKRLEAVAGVPIVIDKSTLDEAGVDLNAKVTIRLVPGPLHRALDAVLKQIAIPTARPGHAPDGGSIFVSTGEALSAGRFVQARIYDVRDILAAITPPPPISGRSGDIRGVDLQYYPEEELAKLVLETVEPDTWREYGGSVGRLIMFNGRMIVTQTWHNHRLLEQLLAEMREPMPSDPTMGEADSIDRGRLAWNYGPSFDLNRPVPDLELSAPLNTAVETIGRQAGIDLRVDEATLRRMELDPSRAVTVVLRNATLLDALDALLAAHRSAAGPASLDFASVGGVLTLTSADRAESVVTHLYDIRKWPAGMRMRQTRAAALLVPLSEDEWIMADRLTAAVQSAIDPDSWRENGGSIGSIRTINGMLVVSQTIRNQERVRRLLTVLRQMAQ